MVLRLKTSAVDFEAIISKILLLQGTELLDLYKNFIAEFENKINPLSLVEILCPYVVRQFSGKLVYDSAFKVDTCVHRSNNYANTKQLYN